MTVWCESGRPSGELRPEVDDEALDLVVFDGEEVADGGAAAAHEQVDLDGDAVVVDDERSRRGAQVVDPEGVVAVEAADRRRAPVDAGGGDELGVVAEAGL